MSISFVVISTCCMCLGTIQSLQVRQGDGSMADNTIINILETLSVLWFTLEYLLRLGSCPAKCDFLRDSLNFLDVAAVLPFYVPLCISWLENSHTGNNRNNLSSEQFRIIKLPNIDFANNRKFCSKMKSFYIAQKHLRL